MKERRLDNVQVLRGVAAFAVVIEHSFDQFGNHPIDGMTLLKSPIGAIWGNGVDLFFVISGFIIYYLTHRHFNEKGYPAEFMKRRVVRVAPIYWLFTTAMILVALAQPVAVNSGVGSAWHAISSYVFIPSPRPDGLYHPVFGLGWTLNYEFFFYAAFTVALMVPARIGLPALIAGFVALALAHPILPPGPLAFWSEPIILEFIVGIFVAMLFVRGMRLNNGVAVGALIAIALVLSFVLDWVIPDIRILRSGIPSILLAGTFILMPDRRWCRVVILIGDASYSLYLSHPFALNAVTALWKKLHLPLDGYSYMTALVLGGLAGGVFVFRFVERPLVETLRPRFKPKRETLGG